MLANHKHMDNKVNAETLQDSATNEAGLSFV